MVDLFKVLGDQNRLRIINLVLDSRLCVCEIESVLGLTQTNVSRHLSKLRNEKIVLPFKDAQWIYYEINPTFLKDNELLINFLKEKFGSSELYLTDKAKYKKFKESGLSCKTLKI